MSTTIKEAAEVVVAEAKEKIAADRAARLIEAKRAAHLDVVVPKARARANFLAGQATKVSTALEETDTVSPEDARALLAARPGLGIPFDRLTETRRHLVAITARTQSSLETALAASASSPLRISRSANGSRYQPRPSGRCRRGFGTPTNALVLAQTMLTKPSGA